MMKQTSTKVNHTATTTTRNNQPLKSQDRENKSIQKLISSKGIQRTVQQEPTTNKNNGERSAEYSIKINLESPMNSSFQHKQQPIVQETQSSKPRTLLQTHNMIPTQQNARDRTKFPVTVKNPVFDAQTTLERWQQKDPRWTSAQIDQYLAVKHVAFKRYKFNIYMLQKAALKIQHYYFQKLARQQRQKQLTQIDQSKSHFIDLNSPLLTEKVINKDDRSCIVLLPVEQQQQQSQTLVDKHHKKNESGIHVQEEKQHQKVVKQGSPLKSFYSPRPNPISNTDKDQAVMLALQKIMDERSLRHSSVHCFSSGSSSHTNTTNRFSAKFQKSQDKYNHLQSFEEKSFVKLKPSSKVIDALTESKATEIFNSYNREREYMSRNKSNSPPRMVQSFNDRVSTGTKTNLLITEHDIDHHKNIIETPSDKNHNSISIKDSPTRTNIIEKRNNSNSSIKRKQKDDSNLEKNISIQDQKRLHWESPFTNKKYSPIRQQNQSLINEQSPNNRQQISNTSNIKVSNNSSLIQNNQAKDLPLQQDNKKQISQNKTADNLKQVDQSQSQLQKIGNNINQKQNNLHKNSVVVSGHNMPTPVQQTQQQQTSSHVLSKSKSSVAEIDLNKKILKSKSQVNFKGITSNNINNGVRNVQNQGSLQSYMQQRLNSSGSQAHLIDQDKPSISNQITQDDLAKSKEKDKEQSIQIQHQKGSSLITPSPNTNNKASQMNQKNMQQNGLIKTLSRTLNEIIPERKSLSASKHNQNQSSSIHKLQSPQQKPLSRFVPLSSKEFNNTIDFSQSNNKGKLDVKQAEGEINLQQHSSKTSLRFSSDLLEPRLSPPHPTKQTVSKSKSSQRPSGFSSKMHKDKYKQYMLNTQDIQTREVLDIKLANDNLLEDITRTPKVMTQLPVLTPQNDPIVINKDVKGQLSPEKGRQNSQSRNEKQTLLQDILERGRLIEQKESQIEQKLQQIGHSQNSFKVLKMQNPKQRQNESSDLSLKTSKGSSTKLNSTIDLTQPSNKNNRQNKLSFNNTSLIDKLPQKSIKEYKNVIGYHAKHSSSSTSLLKIDNANDLKKNQTPNIAQQRSPIIQKRNSGSHNLVMTQVPVSLKSMAEQTDKLLVSSFDQHQQSSNQPTNLNKSMSKRSIGSNKDLAADNERYLKSLKKQYGLQRKRSQDSILSRNTGEQTPQSQQYQQTQLNQQYDSKSVHSRGRSQAVILEKLSNDYQSRMSNTGGGLTNNHNSSNMNSSSLHRSTESIIKKRRDKYQFDKDEKDVKVKALVGKVQATQKEHISEKGIY